MSVLTISDWRLLRLTLQDIGPFRGERHTFRFEGPTASSDGDRLLAPSNMYMLLARNGLGKTTVLASIHGLFGLLAEPAVGIFAEGRIKGRVQLDTRAVWTIDGVSRTVLLSLWIEPGGPLCEIRGSELEDVWQCSSQALVGLSGPGTTRTDELGALFVEQVAAAIGVPPRALRGLSQAMPTILYFPADRSVLAPERKRNVAEPAGWGYQPAQTFATDGPAWETSLDNVLVWLQWLDGRRLRELLDFIDAEVFGEAEGKHLTEPRREDLQTYVRTPDGGLHPLAELSHGERALLQLLVRIVTQMTTNTVVLIDELETHLHTRWLNRFVRALKRLVTEQPSLSLVFSTHQRETFGAYDHQRIEPGLVKGGFLIEEELD